MELIVNQEILIDYINELEPELQAGEAVAIAELLIESLSGVELLRPNIHFLAEKIKQRRQRASDRN